MDSKKVVFESKSGIRLDTPAKDLFERFSYLKDYLISVNPKFNQLDAISATGDLEKMTVKDLADLGNMPAESLIYMMESSISEN
nr:hypothetical protein [uncultured Peptostreptococcus sp.]